MRVRICALFSSGKTEQGNPPQQILLKPRQTPMNVTAYTQNIWTTIKWEFSSEKSPSTDSVVAKYIKSGMDHVASFIVESAIRFGEQHGVVVADKKLPNVYEIVSPDKKCDEKSRKIRFKLTKTTTRGNHKENRKWTGHISRDAILSASDAESRPSEAYCSKSSSWSSKTDSLEDILPLLEKLKNDEKVVTSELDINMFKRENLEEEPPKERLRDRHKVFDKRYKAAGDTPKPSENEDYGTSPWKKRLRRETLDKSRLRPRASTCPRKESSFSPF